MYKISELKELLKNKKMSEKFSGIYGGDKNSIEEAYSRLSSALDEFQKIDKSENILFDDKRYLHQNNNRFQSIVIEQQTQLKFLLKSR